ncbi:MAG: sensor histidine kinase [Oscillospiraceae bacterium]|nr:sensor histidine kinase [Oscillospiraceae bacterium]
MGEKEEEQRMKILNALQLAYTKFYARNMYIPINDGTFPIDSLSALDQLVHKAGEAVAVISNELDIKIDLFIPDELRILSTETIVMNKFSKDESSSSKYSRVDKDNGDNKPVLVTIQKNKLKIIDGWRGKESDNNGLFATDYPVAFLVSFSSENDSEWGLDEIEDDIERSEKRTMFRFYPQIIRNAVNEESYDTHTSLRHALANILCSLAEFIRARGIDIIAQFHSKRMTSFTRVTRHELFQKIQGMNQLLESYEAYLTNYFQKSLNTPIIDNTWENNVFQDNLRVFLLDTKSFVRTTSVQINASRFVDGIPDPEMRFFYPYREFMFKWESIFRELCKNRHIDVDFSEIIRLADSNRPQMYGDPQQIEQVVYNLFLNALKYAHEDTVVEFDLRLDDTKRNYIFEVTNYSTPIPTNEEDSIFNFGVRGYEWMHGDGKDNTGDGLGLHISREIARRHGGDVELIENSHIDNYNIPALLLLPFIQDEWKHGGKYYYLRQPNWQNESLESDALEHSKNLYNTGKFKTSENIIEYSLENLVSNDLLRYIKARTEGFNTLCDLPDFSRDYYSLHKMREYWKRIDKPTNRITFRMTIPHTSNEE